MLQLKPLSGDNKIWLLIAVAGLIAIHFFGEATIQGVQAVTGDSAFDKWNPLFQRFGSQYGVPWRWLKAICLVESSNGQNSRVARGLTDPSDVDGSKSTDGLSWGLMQVTLATAKGLTGRVVTAEELNNPDTSVQLAAQLLRQLIDRFGIDDPESVFRAYNGGPNFGVATYAYWVKIQANLEVVLAGNPGDELE